MHKVRKPQLQLQLARRRGGTRRGTQRNTVGDGNTERHRETQRDPENTQRHREIQRDIERHRDIETHGEI